MEIQLSLYPPRGIIFKINKCANSEKKEKKGKGQVEGLNLEYTIQSHPFLIIIEESAAHECRMVIVQFLIPNFFVGKGINFKPKPSRSQSILKS